MSELYNTFDPSSHLRPPFDKEKFDTLHSWDFGWAIVDSINDAGSTEDETQLSKRLSPGQKAFYFIWHLDAQVTNGGFIQFYWNGYAKYLPPIKEGLKLIGESKIIDLIEKADQEFKSNIDQFITQKKKDDWEPLYEELKKFDEYDSIYYESNEAMMDKLENYARANPDAFFQFRQLP